jgi:DNA-binding transcriptional MerR regulator
MHQSQADRIGAIIDDLLKEQDISEEEITEILSGLNGSENLEESQNTNPEDLQEAVSIFLEMKEEALEEKKRKKKKKKKKKKDACYRKVKARYDVWPSAYASGALVKCRKVGAKNWGNKSKKKNESIDLQEKTDGKKSSDKGYGLDDWFDKGGWVQVGGKYDGKPCAKQPGQTTKPYCRDPDDRKSMSKKEKEKRAAKKRKEDPNPDRKGKAKNVSQKESLDMKITKERLQQIIQEEINNLKEKLSAKDKKEKAKLNKQKKDIEKKLDTIHHK